MSFYNTKSTFRTESDMKFAPRSNASVRPPRRGTTEGTRKTAHTVRTNFLKCLKTVRAVQIFFCEKSDVEFDCEKTIREACWKKKALPTQRSPTKRNSPRSSGPHRVAQPARKWARMTALGGAQKHGFYESKSTCSAWRSHATHWRCPSTCKNNGFHKNE